MKINEIPRKERDNITGDRKKNLIEGGKIWIEFWRKNIEIFVEQYFGIKLHLFQKIIIHMMHKSNYFCWIACRGLRQVIFNCLLLLCCSNIISRYKNSYSIRTKRSSRCCYNRENCSINA